MWNSRLSSSTNLRPPCFATRPVAQPFGAQCFEEAPRVERQIYDRQIEFPEGALREPRPEFLLGRSGGLSPAEDGGHRVGQEALGRHGVEVRGRLVDLGVGDLGECGEVDRHEAVGNRHESPEYLVRRGREGDVIALALAHLGTASVGPLDERRREDYLRFLAALAHYPPAHLHIEQLVDPSDLDVRVEFGGVERHDDGVQLLGHR